MNINKNITVGTYINNIRDKQKAILEVKRAKAEINKIRDEAISNLSKEDLLKAVREIKLNNNPNEPQTIGEELDLEDKKEEEIWTEEEKEELRKIREIQDNFTIEDLNNLLNDINKSHSQYIGNKPLKTIDGGEGSGNFGHRGRPGEVGGSAKNNFNPNVTIEAIKDTMDNLSGIDFNLDNYMKYKEKFGEWLNSDYSNSFMSSEFYTDYYNPEFDRLTKNIEDLLEKEKADLCETISKLSHYSKTSPKAVAYTIASGQLNTVIREEAFNNLPEETKNEIYKLGFMGLIKKLSLLIETDNKILEKNIQPILPLVSKKRVSINAIVESKVSSMSNEDLSMTIKSDSDTISERINKLPEHLKNSANIFYNHLSLFDMNIDSKEPSKSIYGKLTNGAQAVYGFSSIMDCINIDKAEIKNIETLIDNSPNRATTVYRGDSIPITKLKNIKIGDTMAKLMNKTGSISNISYSPQQANYYQRAKDRRRVNTFFIIEDADNIPNYMLSDYPDEKEGFIKTKDKILDRIELSDDGRLLFYMKSKRG